MFQFLDFLTNKSFYVQVWGEQRNPSPDRINTKISTKEYFDRDKDNGVESVSKTLGRVNTNNF